MPEEATRQLGLGILQRVAIREKARLQAHFLSRLYASPESDTIVLCGSMALHGVYLHGRWSKDLDFEASPEFAQRFPEIAARCGLVVKPKEELEHAPRSKTTSAYLFALPSAFYSEVSISVEIFSRSQVAVTSERRAFCTVLHEDIAVSVRPIAEIIGVKIGCVFLREKASDFVDLWLALRSDPSICTQVRNLLGSGLCDANEFTPPAHFDTAAILATLQTLQPEWQEKLAIYMTQVPAFEQVHNDLAEWLPCLVNDERRKEERVFL